MLNFMNKKRKKNGFTLIELIIVIAIIAILAAVAVPKYLQVKENANRKADVTTAKQLADVTSQLIADEQIEPGNVTSIKPSTTAAAGSEAKLIADAMDAKNFTPKARDHKSDEFSITVSSTNSVTIEVGSDQVYPQPDTGYYSK